MKKINTILRGMTFLMCLFSVTVFSQSITITDPVGTVDNSCVNSSGPIAGVPAGNSLESVTLDITHTWSGDLEVTLIAPNGSRVLLQDNRGGSGDNTFATFSDSAGLPISNGSAPFPLDYQPEEPLSSLNGQGNGTWTLEVCDTAGGDSGTVNSFTLGFNTIGPPTPQYCSVNPALNDGSGMTNLQLNNTDIAIPDVTYFDATATSVDFFAGVPGNVSMTFSTFLYPYGVYIYIDVDNSFSFEPSELFFNGTAPANGTLAAQVPMPTALGEYRMRIASGDESFGGFNGDPCNTGTYAVYVDATINVVEAPCDAATIGDTTVQEDCNPNNPVYFVNVDVQTGGDAVSIEANGTGVNANFPIASTGNNQVGPFPSGVEVSLTVVHSDTECNINLGDFVFNCPPINDTCDGAIALTCGSVESGSTEFANSESVPFCDTTLSTANGVWYSFEGTGGDMVIDLSGSLYDTKLGIFTGSCGSYVCVEGDDDGGTGLDSRIQFSTTAGTTYYAYVTGFGSSNGTYTISVDCICDAYIEEGECVKLFSGYGPSSNIDLTAVGQFGLAPYTYEWSDGQTGATVNVAPTSQTTYMVTVTDSAGCTSTAMTTVLVQDISCDDNGNDNNAKVNICHNGEPLCVSTNAVQAHLNHGDTLGACNDDVNCNTAPLCDARLKVPGPEATDVSANVEISWGDATGYVVGYLLSVGTTSGGTDVLDNEDVGLTLDFDLSGLLDYSTTYYVSLTPYNNNGVATEGCGESSFTTEAGPWCDAISVDCNGSVSGNTATDGEVTPGLDFCGTSLTVGPGVWHQFEGTGFEVTAGLCNSSFDTKIGIFTGDCTALTCVTGTDDGGSCSGFLQSEVDFQTVQGQTYYVYVTGFLSAAGAYTLDITCAGPPDVIPACEAAENIDCNTTVSGSTVGFSSNDLDFCGTSLDTAPGRFYKFEATANGPITVTTCGAGTSYDTKLGVFSSTDCATLTCIGGDDDEFSCGFSILQSQVNFNAVTGVTYYIYVTAFGSGSGNFDLTLTCANEREEAETTTFESGEWTLYPNPASNGEVELNLTNYLNKDVSIQMMDFSGKVLVSKDEPNLQTPRYRLSTSSMSYGMYFVRVITDSGVSTKKLIIANN